MKLSRGFLLGLFVAGLSLSVMPSLFAGNDEEEFIHLLENSGAALQSVNPTLAAGLTNLGNEETNALANRGSQQEEDQNSPEGKARQEARVKLLKEAAAALQATRPDLVASLSARAEQSK